MQTKQKELVLFLQDVIKNKPIDYNKTLMLTRGN